ncbi:MAG: glycerophosphodiester phosphodiesterase family protein [Chlamydiota bacterium]
MKILLRISISFCFFLVISSIYSTPLIISHRGGNQNFPENTLFAFSESLALGCDALELDVQVTLDEVVVVFHPEDLKKWTNGSGPVTSHTWNDISGLNVAYNYKPEENFPFKEHELRIPKLEEVLSLFPNTLIVIDLKSLPAKPLVKALVKTISDEESKRLIFYSTNSEHIELLNLHKPLWRTFEKRDYTRQRLLDLNQFGRSNLPLTSSIIGFELKRTMLVTETFALGKGISSVEFHLWTPPLVSHLKKCDPNIFLVLFGINTKSEWEEALHLDVTAIYTDNPREIIKTKKECSLSNTSHTD